VITDLVLGRFCVSPVSGRDLVLASEFDVSWRWGGVQRRMCLPAGLRFGPGVNSMPGIWRAFANPLHLLRASAAHDALYASQGGSRPIYTDMGVDPLETLNRDWRVRISLDFRPFVTRREADLLAGAIAKADGINRAQGLVVTHMLRAFGRAAWDD
jgi:hypothetical protein